MEGTSKVFFDVSSTIRWLGPPVGTIRVENALAAYVVANRPDIVLAVYDPAMAAFRAVMPEWAARITGWDCAIDTLTFDHRRYRSRLRRALSSRYAMFMALERRRLSVGSAMMRQAIDAAQRLLWLPGRMPLPFADQSGRRFDVVPVAAALGERLSLRPGDTIATAGYDWFHQSPSPIGKLKKQQGFRYVAMCHDIIPLQFPEYFPAHHVAEFRSYWHAIFPTADRILVSSRRVESDIRNYCAAAGIRIGETRVTPLGFERPRAGSPVSLPNALQPGRFALFVGTIEPRKGHGLLVKVWRRLLAAGVPQRHGFKLVFVGRRGWKVDALLREIGDRAKFEGTLIHLEHVSNDELDSVYAAAAFCVYPSLYEGYGLPIVEAFAHGKAVLASTGGAVPEAVGGLSPCLDPTDEDTWFVQLGRWIEDPGVRAPYEVQIRRSFSRPDWDEAAAQFFKLAADRRPVPGSREFA